MKKTKTLNPNQLEFLRSQLITKFKVRHPNEDLVLKTYAPAYDDLRNDIIKVIPSKEGSVSLGRLRKLFYYTNPDLCPIKQLETPSFGKDFLEVLEKYIAEEGKVITTTAPSVQNSTEIKNLRQVAKKLIWAVAVLSLIWLNPITVKNYLLDWCVGGRYDYYWEMCDGTLAVNRGIRGHRSDSYVCKSIFDQTDGDCDTEVFSKNDLKLENLCVGKAGMQGKAFVERHGGIDTCYGKGPYYGRLDSFRIVRIGNGCSK